MMMALCYNFTRVLNILGFEHLWPTAQAHIFAHRTGRAKSVESIFEFAFLAHPIQSSSMRWHLSMLAQH